MVLAPKVYAPVFRLEFGVSILNFRHCTVVRIIRFIWQKFQNSKMKRSKCQKIFKFIPLLPLWRQKATLSIEAVTGFISAVGFFFRYL